MEYQNAEIAPKMDYSPFELHNLVSLSNDIVLAYSENSK
jgi:hypothetical protein